MKKMKLIVILFITLAFGFGVNAQIPTSSASAQCFATIITPLAISKNVDMNFGNVVSASSSATVVLSTNSTRTRTGDIILPSPAGTITAAKFTVTGFETSTYAITVPESVELTRTSGSETMVVDHLICSPSPVAYTSTTEITGVLSGGTKDLYIGATLNVGGGQLAGPYTGTLSVTVNYN